MNVTTCEERRRQSRRMAHSVTTIAIVGFAFAFAQPVQADAFRCTAGDVPCLIAAISDANANGKQNTIRLEAGAYILTTFDNDTDGPTGLPSITSNVTIIGDGADVTNIERASGSIPFRLMHVAATGSLTIQGLTLDGGGGSSFRSGAGIFNNGGSLAITNSTLANNQSDSHGAGIFNNAGSLTIRNSTLLNNRTLGLGQGGAIFNNHGGLMISNCFFGGNRGDRGGAIENDGGSVRLTLSTLTGNHASLNGGGIVNDGGTLTISDSSLISNAAIDAGSSGGGIANYGSLAITTTTVAGNSAENNGGGGITNRSGSSLTITDSAIESNTAADGGGGGIRNFSGAELTIVNSTLAANQTRGFGGGGGIVNAGGLQIINSTIARNVANRCGGGISSSTLVGSVTLQNTIVALNVAENTENCSPPSVGTADCFGSVTSLNNNLIGDPTGCTITLLSNDVTGDPGLDTFTDDSTPGNGHFPLLPSSPAIDTGNDEVCPKKDQIGRPRQPTCDMGAVEFVAHAK